METKTKTMREFKDEKELQDFLVETYKKHKLDRRTPVKVEAMDIVGGVYIGAAQWIKEICDTVDNMDAMSDTQAYYIAKAHFRNKK